MPALPAPRRRLFRSVMANAGILAGGKAANALIGLVVIALTARGLGVREFGLLVLIYAFTQTVGDLVRFQSWQVVLQFGSRPWAEGRVGDLQRVLRFSALLDLLGGLAALLVGCVGALFAGRWLGWTADDTPVAIAFATSTVFTAMATPVGVLRLFDRFDLIALQSITANGVRLAGAAVCLTLGAPLASYLLVWWLGAAAAFFSLFGWAVRELRRRGALRDFALRRGGLTDGFPGLWRFAWTTNLSGTLDVAFTHIATLIVGGVANPMSAALYRIARQVGDAVAKPAKLLTPALYPELARLRAEGDDRRLRRLSLRVGLAGGAVATVLLAVSMTFGRPLLATIVGPQFAEAAPVMNWLVAASVIGIWALPLEPMLMSTGRAGVAFSVKLAVTIVFLGALPPLLQRFGLIGAGMAAVGAQTALGLGMLTAVLTTQASVTAQHLTPEDLLGEPLAAAEP